MSNVNKKSWSGSFEDLVKSANKLLPDNLNLITIRTARYYQQSGVLSRGKKIGKQAIFNNEDLDNLVEIKKLTSNHWSINQIIASQKAKKHLKDNTFKNKKVKNKSIEQQEMTPAQLVLQSMIEQEKSNSSLSDSSIFNSQGYVDFKKQFSGNVNSILRSSNNYSENNSNLNCVHKNHIKPTNQSINNNIGNIAVKPNFNKEKYNSALTYPNVQYTLEQAKDELDKKLKEMEKLSQKITYLTTYINEQSHIISGKNHD